MYLDTLNELLEARRAKRPVALITWLASGEQRLVSTDGLASGGGLDASTREAAETAIQSDRSTTIETADGTAFVHVFTPPLRMVIVGAVHITQLLAPMAGLAGYEVTVIDPRRAFATGDRFPDVTVTTEWPDDAMKEIAPDRRTAVVTLTHDPKLDDPALRVALASDAFYIGSLGSKRTHAGRLERLARAGFSQAALGRIHGPVGLPIGARSPAEIAASIIAQMTQVLRQGTSA